MCASTFSSCSCIVTTFGFHKQRKSLHFIILPQGRSPLYFLSGQSETVLLLDSQSRPEKEGYLIEEGKHKGHFQSLLSLSSFFPIFYIPPFTILFGLFSSLRHPLLTVKQISFIHECCVSTMKFTGSVRGSKDHHLLPIPTSAVLTFY